MNNDEKQGMNEERQGYTMIQGGYPEMPAPWRSPKGTRSWHYRHPTTLSRVARHSCYGDEDGEDGASKAGLLAVFVMRSKDDDIHIGCQMTAIAAVAGVVCIGFHFLEGEVKPR